MSSKKLQIVMFNMSLYSEWQQGVQNRNFHVLQNLIKNPQVEKIIAIDYLPHTFKRLLKNSKVLLTKKIGKAVKSSLTTKIFQINNKLSVYSSVLAKMNQKNFYRQLNDFLIANNFKNYVVWSYYPLSVEYFNELPAKLFVFDTVDNWAEHPSYEKFKDRLIDNYKVIDQKADIIFTVSSSLQNLFENLQKVFWLPNGVDLKHYQQKYPIVNRDIGEIKKPIIGYVGTIQDRLDQDLLEYLAKNNRDKSFVLVGPVWYQQIKDRFKPLGNVYFLGRKSYEEVPMYIQQFSVGIIPHKIDKFIKSTNPMKMYEYLACQKPIVSTAGGDIEQFRDLVYITNDFPQFNQYLTEALKPSAKLNRQRLSRVKEHSWTNRVEEMLKLIQQKL